MSQAGFEARRLPPRGTQGSRTVAPVENDSELNSGERLMDRQKLNLHYLTTVRERELLDRVRDTEFDLILSGKVDLASATGGQEGAGNITPLAQDAFCAILFRQGGLHKNA
jgi:hypothetical protein